MSSFGLRLGLAIAALAMANPALARVCDVDADGDVDLEDVRAITGARNQPASGPDDARDADGSGVITVNDARQCVLQCSLPRCVEPPPGKRPLELMFDESNRII